MRRFIPHISGIVVIVLVGAFAAGVFKHQDTQSLLGSAESSLTKYVAPVGNAQSSSSVYHWAYAACKDAPLDVLSMAYHVKLNRRDIERSIAHSFPDSTHSAALHGCERGMRSNHS